MLQVACCCSYQLTIYQKQNSNVSIFISWLSSSLYFGDSVRYFNVNFKLRCFSATQSKFLFESNYLKSTAEGLSFQISFVPNTSKTFVTFFPYCRYWKHARCKCTMVYLKDSFIVSSFLFLFIHNMALLQGLVAITTSWKMPVALVPRNLESWCLPLPRLNCLTFYFAVIVQIMVLV